MNSGALAVARMDPRKKIGSRPKKSCGRALPAVDAKRRFTSNTLADRVLPGQGARIFGWSRSADSARGQWSAVFAAGRTVSLS